MIGNLVRDTAVAGSEGCYTGLLSEQWSVWMPHGGYSMAILPGIDHAIRKADPRTHGLDSRPEAGIRTPRPNDARRATAGRSEVYRSDRRGTR
jgi:hypothetical protein